VNDEEETPTNGDEPLAEITLSPTTLDIVETGRLMINVEGAGATIPRLMIYNVPEQVWIPILLAAGEWVLYQPAKHKTMPRLVVPPGYGNPS
jgi:hypothetical protein